MANKIASRRKIPELQVEHDQGIANCAADGYCVKLGESRVEWTEWCVEEVSWKFGWSIQIQGWWVAFAFFVSHGFVFRGRDVGFSVAAAVAACLHQLYGGVSSQQWNHQHVPTPKQSYQLRSIRLAWGMPFSLNNWIPTVPLQKRHGRVAAFGDCC